MPTESISPVREVDVVNRGGGALDVGVVHHHVESAQIIERLVEPVLDVGFRGDIHAWRRSRSQPGNCPAAASFTSQMCTPRATLWKALAMAAANAAGCRRDHDALAWFSRVAYFFFFATFRFAFISRSSTQGLRRLLCFLEELHHVDEDGVALLISRTARPAACAFAAFIAAVPALRSISGI